MRPRVHGLAAALVAVGCSGCIAVVKGNYSGALRPEGLVCAPTVSVSATLTLTVSGAQLGSGALRSSHDKLQAAVRSRLTEHACLRWSDDPGAADLHLDIRLHEHLNPRLWMAVLSGLTLTLVPAVATSRGTATVKVLRGETVLAARTWQDRSQLWFQMFLVFAMPAAAPRKVAEEQRAVFGDAVVGLVEATVLASPGLMSLAPIDA